MSSDFPAAAGNGLLDRRLFVGGVLGGATAILTAGSANAGAAGEHQPASLRMPGRAADGYGLPAPAERERVKRLALPPDAVGGMNLRSVRFTPLDQLHGTYTPAGLHFELSHQGIPDLDPVRHKLVIHGLVKRPLKFDLEALERYALVSASHFIECSGNTTSSWQNAAANYPLAYSHGLLSASQWSGVPLAALLDEAGLAPGAKWVIAEGADAGSVSRSIPLEKALNDSMIALFQSGERLRPEQGYPMRLLNPGYEGNTNVKWLRSLKLTSGPTMSRFETSRYTDLMPDGKALQFSFEMDVKSVITRPANAHALPRPALYEITGLAWSGSGRVRRVDVTADGGKTWAAALLDEPVLPRMLTRFRIPWRWNGETTVLASRAEDEHGERQPGRAALVAARGTESYYHYNAIHAWGVSTDGSIRQVDA